MQYCDDWTNRSFIRLLIALLASAGCAWTQTPEAIKTVVTVTARPVSQNASAADISIVTPEETPAANSSTLYDLLQFQPGIYVGQNGPRGGMTSVSLRGGDPNFTLFMIDGIPVNDITDQLGGSVDVGNMLPTQVQRI